MVGLIPRPTEDDARLYERLVEIGRRRYSLPVIGARSAAIRTLAVYRDIVLGNPDLADSPRALALTHRNACLRSLEWCLSNRPEPEAPRSPAPAPAPDFSARVGETVSERAGRIRRAARSGEAAGALPALCHLAIWDADREVRGAAHAAVRHLAARALGNKSRPRTRPTPGWEDLMLLRRYLSGDPLSELAAEHRETEAGVRARIGFALECLKHASLGDDDWLNGVLAAVIESEPGPLTPWVHPPAMDAGIEFLVESLGDPSPDTRRNAARNLGECGRRAEDALPALRHVADDDPSPAVRRAARCAVVRVLGWRP